MKLAQYNCVCSDTEVTLVEEKKKLEAEIGHLQVMDYNIICVPMYTYDHYYRLA